MLGAEAADADAAAAAQIGVHRVDASATSCASDQLRFPRPFFQPPWVLATVHGTSDVDDTFVVTLVDTSVSGCSFVVCRVHSDGWDQEIRVHWLAIEPSSPLPDRMRAGSVRVPAAGVAVPPPMRSIWVPFAAAGAGAVEPCILAAVRAPASVGAIAVTVTYANVSGFRANLLPVSGTPWGAEASVSVDYLAFERRVVGDAVTGGPVAVSITAGKYVQSAQLFYRDRYAQTVRLYRDGSGSPAQQADLRYAELRYDVGPLDRGRELVARFTTDLRTAASPDAARWSTSANGLDMLERRYDPLQSDRIAGNYYPTAGAAYLRDTGADVRLSLLAAQSHGCGATRSGELELMLHRRCLRDDQFGVNEVLNETSTIQPQIWLTLETNAASARLQRRLSLLQGDPLSAWFATADGGAAGWNRSYVPVRSLLQQPLPASIHLLSWQLQTATLWTGNATVLRLQHLFDAGEDPDYSVPVSVDLAGLFDPSAFAVASAVETTLTANLPLSELQRLRWTTDASPAHRLAATDGRGLAVTMHPREIRTFLVNGAPFAGRSRFTAAGTSGDTSPERAGPPS